MEGIKRNDSSSVVLQREEEDHDWTKEVRKELADLLDGIPAAKASVDQEKNPLRSLWDFWNALDSILLTRTKRSSSLENDCKATAADYVVLGLTFIDFWLTAISLPPRPQCLAFELCQLSAQNGPLVDGRPFMAEMDNALSSGAAFYLQHLRPQDLEASFLLEAAEAGRNFHSNCSLLYNNAVCVG